MLALRKLNHGVYVVDVHSDAAQRQMRNERGLRVMLCIIFISIKVTDSVHAAHNIILIAALFHATIKLYTTRLIVGAVQNKNAQGIRGNTECSAVFARIRESVDMIVILVSDTRQK